MKKATTIQIRLSFGNFETGDGSSAFVPTDRKDYYYSDIENITTITPEIKGSLQGGVEHADKPDA